MKYSKLWDVYVLHCVNEKSQKRHLEDHFDHFEFLLPFAKKFYHKWEKLRENLNSLITNFSN